MSFTCLALLYQPVIPLKSDLAVELMEKGRVRFWLQADKISANGKVDYVFNESSVSQGEVRQWKIREPLSHLPSPCMCSMIIGAISSF